jgi:hypothetical protein
MHSYYTCVLLMCASSVQELGTSDESEMDLLHERGVYVQVSHCGRQAAVRVLQLGWSPASL